MNNKDAPALNVHQGDQNKLIRRASESILTFFFRVPPVDPKHHLVAVRRPWMLQIKAFTVVKKKQNDHTVFLSHALLYKCQTGSASIHVFLSDRM